jgi:16S rRNA (adenine1518-N6/adenine1519-N6)-dimethyltransferase
VRGPERPRAKKSLGQNFLIDQNIQRRITQALEIEPGDEVLEIGPGSGALTNHLAHEARRLVLVELDDHLAAALRQQFERDEHVAVINADFLRLTLEDLSDDPARLRVIGNIPYNITTPIIFSLLERTPRPRNIVLMVQREVADRILAEPGSRTYGALSVGVRAVANVERVINVGRQAFRPKPDVESTVISITPIVPPPLDPADEHRLRRLTRAAFGQRRKQFQRILRDAYQLSPDDVGGLERKTGFDLRARPETFSPRQFIRLARELA